MQSSVDKETIMCSPGVPAHRHAIGWYMQAYLCLLGAGVSGLASRCQSLDVPAGTAGMQCSCNGGGGFAYQPCRLSDCRRHCSSSSAQPLPHVVPCNLLLICRYLMTTFLYHLWQLQLPCCSCHTQLQQPLQPPRADRFVCLLLISKG